jgi:hypothetical protein
LTGTPIARLIIFDPVVQFKSIEGNSLVANANLGYMKPNLSVEAVLVHAEVEGRIPQADEPG